MQPLTYVVFISLGQCCGGKRPCQPCLASFPGSPEREMYTHAQIQFHVPEQRSLGMRLSHAHFRLCTLASGPMTVVFVLGMRLHVRMRTKLENGVLSNRQQPQSVVKVETLTLHTSVLTSLYSSTCSTYRMHYISCVH